jgi:hypothetical protein
MGHDLRRTKEHPKSRRGCAPRRHLEDQQQRETLMIDSTDQSLASSFPDMPKAMANGQLKSLTTESWYIISQLWFHHDDVASFRFDISRAAPSVGSVSSSAALSTVKDGERVRH